MSPKMRITKRNKMIAEILEGEVKPKIVRKGRHIEVMLNLSPHHIQKIREHHAKTFPKYEPLSLLLKPEHMKSGNHRVLLTQRQINALQKAKAKNVGKTIKISRTQLKKNISSRGGNIFGDVWNGIKDAGKYIWNHKGDILDIGKEVYKHKDEIKDALNAANSLLGKGRRRHHRTHAKGIFNPGGGSVATGSGIYSPGNFH